MTGDASTPRVRRDVQSLIDGGAEGRAVLDAYATAIRKMRALDEPGPGPPTNPLSWRFQAAVHWIDDAGGNPLLKKCQHFSWYFLPWHRLYLYRFERIIQHHLGDDTWSLPYWDYTKLGGGGAPDEEARKLPLPFRQPATGNELFTNQRVGRINQGTAINPIFTDAVQALKKFPFALDPEDPRPTFGGAKAGPGEESTAGSLENTPHGQVHVQVGGKDIDPAAGEQPGWMYHFDTAALDPVFWLHHCNLDRLWEVWVALQRRKGHENPNPDDDVWLRQEFDFADSDGQTKTNAVQSALDTRDLGYVYESIDPPGGVDPITPTPAAERVGVFLAADEPGPMPELVGARTGVPFAEPASVRIELEPPRRALVDDLEGREERWHLRVENIQGTRPEAAAYAFHLNVEGPDALEGPGIRVGLVSSFGIVEMSAPDETHDASGFSVAFDITDAVRELEAAGAWDASHAEVTIVPLGLTGEPVSGGDVYAGRISVYRG